jgi:CBS-domain-containing membrane protein
VLAKADHKKMAAQLASRSRLRKIEELDIAQRHRILTCTASRGTLADYAHDPTVGPEVSLADLEAIFARYDFNGVPVMDGRVLAGMVTKFDVLRIFIFTPQQIVPSYAELQKLTAGQIMTRDVITFAPDAPLTRVLQTLVDFG